MMGEVLTLKKKKEASLEVFKLDASLLTGANLQEIAATSSFWAQGKVIVLDSLEKIKKPFLDVLLSMSHSSLEVSFIAGASSLKGLSELLEKGKKEIVLLDLSQEKPWDRQSRLREWVVDLAKKQSKVFSGESLALFFERTGLDYTLLEQEVHKLSSYVGDKNIIEAKDVEAVGVVAASSSLWQLADSLIWEPKKIREPRFEDVSSVLSFIPLLRSQLQTGLQLKFLINAPKEEIAEAFPQLRPQTLESMLKNSQKRSFHFFIAALKALFELELDLKSRGLPCEILWDLFKGKLAEAQN